MWGWASLHARGSSRPPSWEVGAQPEGWVWLDANQAGFPTSAMVSSNFERKFVLSAAESQLQ